MDLLADLRALVDRELIALGYQPDPGLALHKLINLLFDALKRRVAAKPRQVAKAGDFACPPALTAGLTMLEKAIESGADLTPHLSTRLEALEFVDGMLLEWGLHHFHLGTAPHPKKTGFVERTGDILYAAVAADTIYFLAIMPHNEWSNDRLLQIIKDNWEELLTPFKLPQGTSLAAPSPSASDREMLRRAGINTLTALADGTLVVPPGGGRTLGKTSVAGSSRANYLLNLMDRIARDINNGTLNLGSTKQNQIRLTRIDSFTAPTQVTLDVAGRLVDVKIDTSSAAPPSP